MQAEKKRHLTFFIAIEYGDDFMPGFPLFWDRGQGFIAVVGRQLIFAPCTEDSAAHPDGRGGGLVFQFSVVRHGSQQLGEALQEKWDLNMGKEHGIHERTIPSAGRGEGGVNSTLRNTDTDASTKGSKSLPRSHFWATHSFVPAAAFVGWSDKHFQ